MANLRAIVIVLVSVMILASVLGHVGSRAGDKSPLKSLEKLGSIAKAGCPGDPDCTSCKTDRDCGDNEYCDGWFCVASVCGDGKCTKGETESSCASDCSETTGGHSCNTDDTCDPDETCDCADCANAGRCQNLDDGSACYQNSQCASGSCVNNICQASGGGENGGGGQPGGGENGGGGRNCATPESSVPFYSDRYCDYVDDCGTDADRCVNKRCVWDDPSDMTVACPSGSSCPSYYVPTGWGCGSNAWYGFNTLEVKKIEKITVPNSWDGEYLKYTIFFIANARPPNSQADHATMNCVIKPIDRDLPLPFMQAPTINGVPSNPEAHHVNKLHPDDGRYEIFCPFTSMSGYFYNENICIGRKNLGDFGTRFRLICDVAWYCRRANGEYYGCGTGNDPSAVAYFTAPDDTPPSTTATYTRYKRPAGSQQYGQEDGSISSTGGLQSVSAYAIKAEFSCSDDLSGCFGTKYCVSDSVCQPDKDFSSPVWLGGAVADGQEKAYTVCYSSSDNSGNAEQRKCDVVTIDKKGPVLGATYTAKDKDGNVLATLDGSEVGAGVYGYEVDVSLYCDDAGSPESTCAQARMCVSSSECNPWSSGFDAELGKVSATIGKGLSEGQDRKVYVCYASKDRIGNKGQTLCNPVVSDKKKPAVSGSLKEIWATGDSYLLVLSGGALRVTDSYGIDRIFAGVDSNGNRKYEGEPEMFYHEFVSGSNERSYGTLVNRPSFLPIIPNKPRAWLWAYDKAGNVNFLAYELEVREANCINRLDDDNDGKVDIFDEDCTVSLLSISAYKDPYRTVPAGTAVTEGSNVYVEVPFEMTLPSGGPAGSYSLNWKGPFDLIIDPQSRRP